MLLLRPVGLRHIIAIVSIRLQVPRSHCLDPLKFTAAYYSDQTESSEGSKPLGADIMLTQRFNP